MTAAVIRPRPPVSGVYCRRNNDDATSTRYRVTTDRIKPGMVERMSPTRSPLPCVVREDGPLGYGAHSDLERILESELYRFTRVYYEIVQRLVTAQ